MGLMNSKKKRQILHSINTYHSALRRQVMGMINSQQRKYTVFRGGELWD